MVRLFFAMTLMLVNCQSGLAEDTLQEVLDNYVLEVDRLLKSDEKIELKVQYLVEIDQGIRDLIKRSENNSKLTWKNSYQNIGLIADYFAGEGLMYNGLILKKAYSLDSDHLLEYTFFSKMNADVNCWSLDSSNVNAGWAYLEKFPHGPFALDVYYNLGGFYLDLLVDIQHAKRFFGNKKVFMGERKHFYGGVTFFTYIIDDKRTLVEQENNARAKLKQLWDKYLALSEEKPKWVRQILQDIGKGGDIHVYFGTCDVGC